MQRTIILILGVFLVINNTNIFIKYLSTVLAVLGSGVAMMQHFNGWKRINAGTFEISEQWYLDPFILSGCALFIIVGQIYILISRPNAIYRL